MSMASARRWASGHRRSERLRSELIFAVGIVLEVVLVFGLGFPEGAGFADLGHDLAGPNA